MSWFRVSWDGHWRSTLDLLSINEPDYCQWSGISYSVTGKFKHGKVFQFRLIIKILKTCGVNTFKEKSIIWVNQICFNLFATYFGFDLFIPISLDCKTDIFKLNEALAFHVVKQHILVILKLFSPRYSEHRCFLKSVLSQNHSRFWQIHLSKSGMTDQLDSRDDGVPVASSWEEKYKKHC